MEARCLGVLGLPLSCEAPRQTRQHTRLCRVSPPLYKCAPFYSIKRPKFLSPTFSELLRIKVVSLLTYQSRVLILARAAPLTLPGFSSSLSG